MNPFAAFLFFVLCTAMAATKHAMGRHPNSDGKRIFAAFYLVAIIVWFTGLKDVIAPEMSVFGQLTTTIIMPPVFSALILLIWGGCQSLFVIDEKTTSETSKVPFDTGK